MEDKDVAAAQNSAPESTDAVAELNEDELDSVSGGHLASAETNPLYSPG